MRTQLFLSALICLSIVSLPACTRGKQASNPTQDQHEEELQGAASPSATQNKDPVGAASKASISCPSQDCPSGAGLLISLTKTPSTFESCQAFLVSPTVALTSSDCLPEELRLTGVSCQGRVKLYFPKTASEHAEDVECAEVLSVSDPEFPGSIAKPRTSFLRLANALARRPLNLKLSGMAADSDILLTRIHVLSAGTAQVEMTLERCRSVRDTLALIPSAGARTPLLALADCPADLTSRGAPILDAQTGQAAGVFHSSVSTEVLEQVKKTLGFAPSAFSYASQLSCIPSASFPADVLASSDPAAFAVAADLAPTCEAHSILLPAQAQKERPVALKPNPLNGVSKVEAGARKWMQGNSRIFRWRTQLLTRIQAVNTQSSAHFTVIPECFQKPEKWVGDFKSWSPWRKVPKTASFQINLPVWEVSTSLNKFLQPSYETSFLQADLVTIELTPERMLQKRLGNVRILEKTSADARALRMEISDLKPCDSENP